MEKMRTSICVQKHQSALHVSFLLPPPPPRWKSKFYNFFDLYKFRYMHISLHTNNLSNHQTQLLSYYRKLFFVHAGWHEESVWLNG